MGFDLLTLVKSTVFQQGKLIFHNNEEHSFCNLWVCKLEIIVESPQIGLGKGRQWLLPK